MSTSGPCLGPMVSGSVGIRADIDSIALLAGEVLIQINISVRRVGHIRRSAIWRHLEMIVLRNA